MFYLCGEIIQTNKTDLISQRYQTMIISILKNLSYKYSNNYFIKFVSYILIYYTINLNFILSYMIFSCLYLEFIDLLQV